MSACSGQFSQFINDIEYSLFNKDGNIDDGTFERLTSCNSEQHEKLIVETRNLLQYLSTGDYHSIIGGPFAKQLLGHNVDMTDYGTYLKEQISNELSSQSKEVLLVRQLNILLLGISCLQLLIQQNWLGPPLNGSCDVNYLEICFKSDGEVDALRNQALSCLRQDGEDVYVLVEFPEFLLVARTILLDCGHLLTDMKTLPLWQVRCNLIHQQLLDDLSPTLKVEVSSAMEKFNFDDKDLPREVLCSIHLEYGYHLLQYHEHGKAKEHFETAQKHLGLEISLEGALGKRTKFQEIDYTQLIAKAKINDHKENDVCDKRECEYLPKDILLEDDTFLNKTKFTNSDSTIQEEMNNWHQAAVLAVCFYKQKSQANHELVEEELLANVMLLLSQPQIWVIQTVALLLRSKLEKKSSRRKERSMMQVQELVEQYRSSNAKFSDRLRMFYSICFPARWKLERELAGLYRELTITKSALEIYERLHLWEDVISCYISLGRYEKAETVVREQLSVKETPKLWCLLGDVTKNEEYYHKAWELSERRSARAQRSLGFLYLRDKKFKESVPCFQKSVEINSLQENVWFSLGCAAMFSEDLDLAAKAFQWCVSMNSDNSEAWNNLSSIYIKTNQKDRAFRALQEALKANYENWQMWENFLLVKISSSWTFLLSKLPDMTSNEEMQISFLLFLASKIPHLMSYPVSTDIGAFEEVMSTLHRLMDLREKYIDVEILQILVSAVVSGKEDRKGVPASRMKDRLKKLMGRITSQITSNSDIWKLYSELYKDGETEDEKQKFLQYLIKAHGVKMQTPDWIKTKDGAEDVIKLSLELSQAYYEASQGVNNSTKSIQLLSSSKLNLKGLLTKVKNNSSSAVPDELDNSLKESLSKLEKELERILKGIETLKSST